MDEEDETIEFHEMGLDDRILKAVAKLGWAKPTLIQEKAIPLALEGKDILARARTGSGKTAAYAIPVIQNILRFKQELCSSCSREVRCVDVSGQVALASQASLLKEMPDVVVGTPSRILAHLQTGSLCVKTSLQTVVIDEADLIFSFGYEADVKAILSFLPKIYQAFLMSATLSEDVRSLKKLILHSPITCILKLEESQLPESSQLTQYHIKCEDTDKFVLIYTLLKLRLIRGKSILFVNTVDRCYRLKLFLEQFQIPACVLNSELPVNSRCHIVTQFNEGLYDIIIAADEMALESHGDVKPSTDKPQNKHKKSKHRDKESGVSRGIDFHNVSNVINFDFPLDVDSYIHRVGRTARGDNQGTALSFVNMKEMDRLKAVEATLAEGHADGETVFKPYQFKMNEIEGFRYRAQDAMRSVTKVAVREARLKEIKQEIMTSQHLKAYFEDNPRDMQLLRHDKNLHTVKIQPHLQNVPDYLIPKTLRGSRNANRSRTPRARSHQSQRRPNPRQQHQRKRKSADPLKTFQFTGLSNKKRRK